MDICFRYASGHSDQVDGLMGEDGCLVVLAEKLLRWFAGLMAVSGYTLYSPSNICKYILV